MISVQEESLKETPVMNIPREKNICGHSGKATTHKPWEKSAPKTPWPWTSVLNLPVCGALLWPPKLTKTVTQVVRGRTKTQSYFLIIQNITPNK